MTTDRTRRAVRWGAVAGVVALGAGATLAIGADPYPASNQPADPNLAQVAATERALLLEARQVDAEHARRWDAYRARLAQRQEAIAARAAQVATPSEPVAPAATYVPDPPVVSSGSS